MREMLTDADHKSVCKRIGPVLNELKPMAHGAKTLLLTSLSNLKVLESSLEQRGRLLFHSVVAQVCRLASDKLGLSIAKRCVSDILKQTIIVRGRTHDGMIARRVVHRDSDRFQVCWDWPSSGSLIYANIVER